MLQAVASFEDAEYKFYEGKCDLIADNSGCNLQTNFEY